MLLKSNPTDPIDAPHETRPIQPADDRPTRDPQKRRRRRRSARPQPGRAARHHRPLPPRDGSVPQARALRVPPSCSRSSWCGSDPACPRPSRRQKRRRPSSLRSPAPPPRRLSRRRALNTALTLALAAVVVWLLWPAGSLHVRSVSVRATPGVVGCEKDSRTWSPSSRTDGNAGRLSYRWTRNDGVGSVTPGAVALEGPAQRRPAPDLVVPRPRHLQRAGHGAAAQRPVTQSATVNFSYVC